MLKAVLLYGALVYGIYKILRIKNIIGVSKAVDNAIEAELRFKKELRTQQIILSVLDRLEDVYYTLGFKATPTKIADVDSVIKRLEISLGLDRTISPISYLGFVKVTKFIGFFFVVWAYLMGRLFLGLFGVLLILFDFLYMMLAKKTIEDKNRELEDAFPKLYLMLYSRLTKGVKATLTPTLDSYLNSLNSFHVKGNEEIILFINRFKSNINLYGEFIAVQKMRDIYSNSAMIVNFCNLAVQALSGTDNEDKLSAFKIELNQRELNLATKRAERLFERGVKVQYLIFVILFQFILISWISKAGESNLFSLIR